MSKKLLMTFAIVSTSILVVALLVFLAVPKINDLISDDVRDIIKEPETQNIENVQNTQDNNTVAEEVKIISVFTPKNGDKISSPLAIRGEARGYWFFEGSFPIVLEDSNGNVVATGFATAGADWMTEQMVPFTSELTFVTPASNSGVLVLKKDNPSDLPENDDEVRIPVVFDKSTLTLKVYFPNYSTNNNDCQEVLGVERVVPMTVAVAKTAIEELLKGLTPVDVTAGYFTSINEGVKLNSISITNGVAYVDFDSKLEYQVGGSCRIMGIYAQIEETLKQFTTINSVVISIDGRTGDILQP
ncbi:MAG: hypothetical protein ACD_18C00124G0002 [uncultured bacterium]|nr:MAG: hypothetical protein ACD_18C00124G0002 [uncultured bacterium]